MRSIGRSSKRSFARFASVCSHLAGSASVARQYWGLTSVRIATSGMTMGFRSRFSIVINAAYAVWVDAKIISIATLAAAAILTRSASHTHVWRMRCIRTVRFASRISFSRPFRLPSCSAVTRYIRIAYENCNCRSLGSSHCVVPSATFRCISTRISGQKWTGRLRKHQCLRSIRMCRLVSYVTTASNLHRYSSMCLATSALIAAPTTHVVPKHPS